MSRRTALALLAAAVCGVAGVNFSAASFSAASLNPDNTFETAVDWMAPSVAMGDPGTPLRGTSALTATASDSGSGVASVRMERSPAGQGVWTEICTDASGPSYDCTWSTASASDGLYDLRAVATDYAGTTTASAVVEGRRVDNTAPSAASMTDPGSPLRGAVTLSGSGTDAGSGVVSVTFQRSLAGTGNWTDVCAALSSPYTCTWATTGVADGLYDLRAVVTDAAGNATTSSLVQDRRVDNTDPTVAASDPGQYLRSTVSVVATASDAGSGVATVSVERSAAGANAWTSVCADSSSPYACSLDTTTLPDGLYDLRAIATDAAGNATTSVLVQNRRVDNTAPGSASLTDPGSPLRGSVTLDGTAGADGGSGLASLTFQRSPAGTSTWADICSDATAPHTCAWATTGDGLYDLRAVAADNAGNTTASSVVQNRRVDNTAPTATDVQANVGNNTLSAGDSLTLTYSEAMAPASVLSGWDGTSQQVRVTVSPGATATTDTLTVTTAAGAVVNLGSVNLNGNFVRNNPAIFNAAMQQSGGSTTLVLGTVVSGAQGGNLQTSGAAGNMVWTPSGTATDVAGNAGSTAPRTETGTADRDF